MNNILNQTWTFISSPVSSGLRWRPGSGADLTGHENRRASSASAGARAVHKTWAQGVGKEPWPLLILPWAPHSHWNSSDLPACWPRQGDSWWEMLSPSHDSFLPQRADHPAQRLRLLTLLLLLSLAEHLQPAALIQKFSHVQAFLSSPCPDCVIPYQMMLTASSLVFWAQVSPPILPLHKGYNNFSPVYHWLGCALALKAVASFRVFPFGETKGSMFWNFQHYFASFL